MTDQSLTHRLQAWPRGWFALVLAAAAVGLCALFYPPRLAILGKKDVRYQEWARADGFLRQCADPLRQDVEPALRWRVLPPLVCRALGLGGAAALAVPVLGLLLLFALLAARLDALTGRRGLATLGTLGFATSGGPITMVNWLGINDGWWLLALLETATGRSRLGLFICGLLAPWVDERYLIGLPLALLVRWLLTAERQETSTFRRQLATVIMAIVPYVGLRMWFSLTQGDAASANYLRDMLEVYRDYAAYVPVGWAMGFRALWLPLGICLAASRAADRHVSGTSLVVTMGLTLGALSVVAWDISRSTAILLPVFILAVVSSARSPSWRGGPRLWLAALVLNLCLPYAHVVGPTLTWNHGPLNLWGWLVP